MQKEICWHVAVEHPGQSGPNIQEHLEVCDLCPFYICDGLHIPGKNSAGEKPQEKEQPLDQAAPCPFSLADVQMRVEAALRQLWHLAYICILIKECRPMLEWWCTSILSAFNISIFLGPVLWACLNFFFFFFPPPTWILSQNCSPFLWSCPWSLQPISQTPSAFFQALFPVLWIPFWSFRHFCCSQQRHLHQVLHSIMPMRAHLDWICPNVQLRTGPNHKVMVSFAYVKVHSPSSVLCLCRDWHNETQPWFSAWTILQ